MNFIRNRPKDYKNEPLDLSIPIGIVTGIILGFLAHHYFPDVPTYRIIIAACIWAFLACPILGSIQRW